jgi:hypothetical protein
MVAGTGVENNTAADDPFTSSSVLSEESSACSKAVSTPPPGKPGGTFRRRGQYLSLPYAQVQGRVGPVLDVSKNVRC